MPEFEDDKENASQSETYTPSTDASNKPRTRRRSGGFKTEVAQISNAQIGEVDPVRALKEEKLSGQASSADESTARTERSDRPSQRDRSDQRERSDRPDREPRQKREPRASREPRAPRTDANPQPSPETLAAIASVEAKITERQAEWKRNRPVKSGGSSRVRSGGASSAPRSGTKPSAGTAPKPSEGGVLAAIGGFFGKLFGSAPEPARKSGARRSAQSRSGGAPGRSSQRNGGGAKNRGRSGQSGAGGNRGGQGRKREGKGPRGSDRRSNEKSSS